MNVGQVDTLEFGIEVGNYEKLGSFLQDINEKRDLAQETRQKITIEAANRLFTVFPGGKPPAYRYHIENDEFGLYFAKSNRGKNSPVFVEVRQKMLWERGAQESYETITNFVQELGAEVTGDKISRIDLCCHTDEMSVWGDRMIKTAVGGFKKFRPYLDRSGNYESMYFGKSGPILCRIYDKSKEIEASQKDWFKSLWKFHGLNIDKNIINVEFQVRREALKEMGISSVKECLDQLPGVWRYLTEKWLTFRKNPKDYKRPVTLRWWEKVQDCKNFDRPANKIIREKIKNDDLYILLRGYFGYLTSISALLADQRDTPNLNMAMFNLKPVLEDYMTEEGKDFNQVVFEKQLLRTIDMMIKDGNYKAAGNIKVILNQVKKAIGQ